MSHTARTFFRIYYKLQEKKAIWKNTWSRIPGTGGEITALDMLLVKCSSATHFHNSSLKQYSTTFNSNKEKEETIRLNLTWNIRKITCAYTERSEFKRRHPKDSPNLPSLLDLTDCCSSAISIYHQIQRVWGNTYHHLHQWRWSWE